MHASWRSWSCSSYRTGSPGWMRWPQVAAQMPSYRAGKTWPGVMFCPFSIEFVESHLRKAESRCALELVAVRALPTDDQLTFLIGRLTRVAVTLDITVRQASWQLSGGTGDFRVGDRSFSDAIRTCRSLVSQHLNGPLQPHAFAALDQAQAAYNLRSRFSHDQFFEHFDAPRFSQVRFGVSPTQAKTPPSLTDLQTVVDAIFEVLRQAARMRALMFLAIPGRDDGDFQSDILRDERLYIHWSGAASITDHGFLDETDISVPVSRRPAP